MPVSAILAHQQSDPPVLPRGPEGPEPIPPSLPARGERLRRAADVIVAALALVLTAPLMLLIVVAIRIEDGGPAIYRQARAGRGRSLFLMLKFRTMRQQAHGEPVPLAAGEKDPRDPRVTRVGRLLRRTSLDELPQLVNVLRGEMSIVGPRPLPVDEALAVPGWAAARWSVAPGLTGLWQVEGRSLIGWGDRMDLDVAYVRHRSPSLDAYVVARTVWAVASGRGAY